MTTTTPKTRIFRYAEHTFPEPGQAFTTEQVKEHLASTFPEIAHATTEEKELDDGTVEITFRKQVARKGSDISTLPQLIEVLGEMPAITDPMPDILTTLGNNPTLQTLATHYEPIHNYDNLCYQTGWRLDQFISKCLQISPTPFSHLPLGF